MIENITLENFKSSKKTEVRIANLTILSGLNGSGKSTILQAIALIKQSIASNSDNKILLRGPLVQLGKFGDILTEGADLDVVSIKFSEDGHEYKWSFTSHPDNDEATPAQSPEEIPNFLKTRYFQYLQADRIVPRTLYPQSAGLTEGTGLLGAHGEYTIDFLEQANLSGAYSVSEKRLNDLARLNLPEKISSRVSPTNKLSDQVSGWLQHLSPGSRLFTERVSGTDDVKLSFGYLSARGAEYDSNTYRPTNVGFGLTYCLPIVVSCLASPAGASLLLLENPEAHLHPKGQEALGELLARCASDGVQIIVETHSDHVLNGIRLSVKKGIISDTEVAVHFFTRDMETGISKIASPAILKNGKLSNWPENFFDQWDRSLDELLS